MTYIAEEVQMGWDSVCDRVIFRLGVATKVGVSMKLMDGDVEGVARLSESVGEEDPFAVTDAANSVIVALGV